jgi:YebC/PmpR family DNA-binding regulatory protein|uniref:Probable transcriptional regulatory protein ENV79_02825 n=1 Tax=candidate division WOR-3 bacterium TaxID=2052148 RepID=A0A7V5XZR4_UNCW3
MAGHSKWAQIKHKKAKVDRMRGNLFSKLAREITTAARLGGGNPDFNPRLRAAIEAAKEANMPSENIERAIKRGTGELPGVVYEEIEFEGYGPEGVAVIVKVLTDNRNRTVNDIRHIFSKYGGNLGQAGSVSWQFRPKGVIMVSKDKVNEETIFAVALEAGAEDIKTDETSYQIITAPEDFSRVKEKLKENNIPIDHSELTKLPLTTVTITDEKVAEKILKLISAFEELEEVQQVYSNFDINESILEKFATKE